MKGEENKIEITLNKIADAREGVRDALLNEFEDSYTDFELAKLMVEDGQEDMEWEDWLEIKFEEYCEHR